MTEILPKRRKTLSNQSIKQASNQAINRFNAYSVIFFCQIHDRYLNDFMQFVLVGLSCNIVYIDKDDKKWKCSNNCPLRLNLF